VTDPAGLAAVVAAVGSSGGAVGLDCETTGLDPRSAEVRLLQVAAPAGTFVIDLSFRHSQVRPSHLGPLFAALAGAEVVGHNLQFDLRFLAPLGFAPGRCFDTMLASQVLHAGGRTAAGGRLRHTLEAAAERELGRTPDKAHQKADWCKPLTPGMLAYAAADAAVLPLLAEALKVKLAAAGLTDTAALEMRALPGVAWAGPVVVDAPAWTAAALAAEGEKDRLAGEMDALVPNPAGLTGGWGWTRRADVLAAFAAAGVGLPDTKDETLAGVDHPLGVLFRAWRAADTRVKGFGRRWLAKNARGGRVLPSWQQIGSDETAVDTGRMSCSGPNLQQLPNDPVYRLCFAARPGHVLVKADYSQVELRIAARVADERLMLDAYRDGRDLHTLTAARMLGKAEADVTKADRQLAKAANFGLLYGMGRRKLAAYALAGFGVRLSEAEAGRHRRAFLAAYPALRRWQERVGGRVEESFRKDPGSVIESRTLGGRRRLIPVAVRPPARPAYPNRTAALNFPVQGTGADGLKAAIGLLWERRAECPAAVPVIFCHDEIVIEAPAADATAAAAWLKRAMVDGMAPLIAPVPVEVDVSVGPTWGG
jgi:DNA polymerase-1